MVERRFEPCSRCLVEVSCSHIAKAIAANVVFVPYVVFTLKGARSTTQGFSWNLHIACNGLCDTSIETIELVPTSTIAAVLSWVCFA